MSSHKEMSQELFKAQQLLERIRGKTLSSTERKREAILLASYMLEEANRIQTRAEKKVQKELSRMMQDARGKVFTSRMTDECFRSRSHTVIAKHLLYLLNQFGIPSYLNPLKRCALGFFQLLGQTWAPFLIPFVKNMIRKQTRNVILPGEKRALFHHLRKRRCEGVRLNLNHLGEAILGEEESQRRLQLYLDDLAHPEIEYISVKISTIFSQINVLSFKESLNFLSERLRSLYRAAQKHYFVRADGTKVVKFVNLDMEEYRDLDLTVELFKKVLSEEEFHTLSAGIVLQAYLPDAHFYQKNLTQWAIERVRNKGAPIKIRIVKGANLAMEQVDASLHDWPQAPYRCKVDVDANYKRMMLYGALPENVKAVHLGIASHNIFDIAYGMILRAEYSLEKEISFEMLEGMADPLRRVVQKIAKEVLLYCPIATKEDFQSAVAYLIRRLDENTGADNFLRYSFGLKPHTPIWEQQVGLFEKACDEMGQLFLGPRRTQNRFENPVSLDETALFANELDTDFCLQSNREWAHDILETWASKKIDPIPCVIGGKEYHQKEPQGQGINPSSPHSIYYTYTQAQVSDVDEALNVAKSFEKEWAETAFKKRCQLLSQAAQILREKRGDLIGAMVMDGGKSIVEADPEISEAIDFAEYYLRSARKMMLCPDIVWRPKGTYLVASPWNFPVSIPAGGILAALVMGNCVIFKPAPEAVLSGWMLVQALWKAGIPKKALQFISCKDDPTGSYLIQDPRLSGVILTGATATSHLFLQMRPDLHLLAETGGKNSMIITAMSDRDLAIKHLIQSAFGHSGQKCSAASVAILEAEVYDDPNFKKQLKDAVLSLKVGPAHDPASKITPLIHRPNPTLYRALTTLDPGEEWLLTPQQDPQNPQLWSPGVKWGVKEGSFMHQTELFGPVLAVMRAKNLEHAVQMANNTPYGLTAGLHSLSEKEHDFWLSHIKAGNLYINRTITGAIVRRQPFGGCKASGYGPGHKAGGPNYLSQLATPIPTTLPKEKHPIPRAIEHLSKFLENVSLSADELGIWYASLAHYAFWASKFGQKHDASLILGQDNFLSYVPLEGLCFRIQAQDRLLDILRVCAAALSCSTTLHISYDPKEISFQITSDWKKKMPLFHFIPEDQSRFIHRLEQGMFHRVRLLSPATPLLQKAAAKKACFIDDAPILASGRFELLRYLREVSISYDYHRYGNLGVREGEHRKPLM